MCGVRALSSHPSVRAVRPTDGGNGLWSRRVQLGQNEFRVSDGLRWTQDAAGGLRLVDLSHGQFPLAQKAGERMS